MIHQFNANVSVDGFSIQIASYWSTKQSETITTPYQPGNYVYILGMDFGFEDADSFTVLGWRESST